MTIHQYQSRWQSISPTADCRRDTHKQRVITKPWYNVCRGFSYVMMEWGGEDSLEMASSTASCGGCPGSPPPPEQQRRWGRRPLRRARALAGAGRRWSGSARSRERSASARHAIAAAAVVVGVYFRSPRPRADFFFRVRVCLLDLRFRGGPPSRVNRFFFFRFFQKW
jgi:hypothetical protein